MKIGTLLFAAVLSTAASVSSATGVRHDEGIGFYVGIDARATLPAGANPNHNRLSLLLDHGDHFHGIGTYSLVGPAPHPAILPTNANNRIPEMFSGEPGLTLTAGTGLYAGKLRSSVGASEYSHLGIASIRSLAGHAPASPEDVLLQSSGNRWSQTLDGVVVGLQMISATPGLKVGTEAVADLFAASDTILLGPGNTFEFQPVYWVAGSAMPGSYSASFRLVNVAAASPIGDSGSFHFDFAVAAAPVPEPEVYAMLVLGLPLVGWLARRRKAVTA